MFSDTSVIFLPITGEHESNMVMTTRLALKSTKGHCFSGEVVKYLVDKLIRVCHIWPKKITRNPFQKIVQRFAGYSEFFPRTLLNNN